MATAEPDTSPSAEPRITDNGEQSRFELHVGDALVGFAEYRLGKARMTVTHTEIDPDYRGQGLASRLIRHVLDSARERELPVIPQCPYTNRWIIQHPEYVGLVPEDQRARYDLA
ncbi:GNAT family N-acetyltransferase [Streptomyces sp. YIM 98790]|uniref:GNAT family N-acetyltransferase n=1 Tax=Streptomyces sp. YIM 98790 TaxID=2689077 RepID=UPI00140C509C|nr:GNAT family N-acetyltransferase [Streptomyces sp. YIM 98790]